MSLSTLPEQVRAVKVDVWAKPIPRGTPTQPVAPRSVHRAGAKTPAGNPAIVLTQATDNENIK